MARSLELVAPAGTLASFRAAIDAGADTVYCGFRDTTNARNYPGLNFDLAEMAQAATYAHERKRKILVAVNSFPRAGAPEDWHRAIDNAASIGADAVILADIGLLDYACRKHPALRRHLSVQASAASPEAIAFYKDNFDIKRVVLPRVLSLEEVADVVARTKLEIEVFCFGSVGPMSEGRCFLSSYLTGRSPSSYGACAPASHVSYRQEGACTLSCLGDAVLNKFGKDEPAAYPTPCKGRYLVNGEPRYLFEEPVGWNAIDLLAQLREAGVTALKIEGRQRSRAYVAEVVASFRKALDEESVTRDSLSLLAEGGRQTTGAYEKGWK